ncbi:MAG: hypothetical protein J5I99_09305 [Verrucomicrobia bacterium]|nr:hypothetical protein [Kiritimatiellia bacterium]MCO6401410.1 hypothetical protein [Verrucomicrobiota bacterium]
MRLWVGFVMLIFAGVASAQEGAAVRFVNGTPIKGELVSVKPGGLELSVEGTRKLFPWSAFSPATRFRYEQGYRDNLATAQRGRPPAEWTNSLSGAVVAAPMSLRALPPISDRPRARLPGFRVSDGADAVAWGFRYGAKDSEAVFAVLEATGNDELPSSLLLWSSPSSNPETLSGSRRASGSEATMSFPSKRFVSVREGVEVQSDLAFSVLGREPGVPNVVLDVVLKKGGASSSFSLVGVPPGFLLGEGSIAAQDLLVSPTMKWGVGRGVLSGEVRMNRLQLFPRSGMGSVVDVSVSDGEGRVLMEERVPFREGRQNAGPALEVSLKRLPSGQTYVLKARVDLGPFLGVLQHEQSFVAQ